MKFINIYILYKDVVHTYFMHYEVYKWKALEVLNLKTEYFPKQKQSALSISLCIPSIHIEQRLHYIYKNIPIKKK